MPIPPKKPDLKVLSFPKSAAPPPKATMGFNILHLEVKSEETSAVIDFLNAHVAELPPSPQNLLSLIWAATRTLMHQGLPVEGVEMIVHTMVDRAVNWVDEGPAKKPPKKSG